MKLIDAYEKINKFANIPFEKFLSPSQLEDKMLKYNKGKTGQLLEKTIGLNLSNTTLDFEDGELKTNKCDKTGKPLETIFITQISSFIDELLSKQDFQSTKLYKKIKNILYVPISKDGPTSKWMYLTPIHIDLSLPKYEKLSKILEKDYNDICNELVCQLSTSDSLHTANGRFIQIRTKDSKPYNPIYSKLYKKEISDKNRAFYFKKDFIKYIKTL
jgi:DNA mismatch repair protein MutH